MAEHITKEIITVRVGDVVSANFQRPIQANLVKEIADAFDIHKFDYPSVGMEGDKYVVWDGQHRMAAVKMKFGDDAMVDVFFDNVGYKEMARMFAEQDKGKRVVSTIDKFKARVESEENEIVDIRNILDKYNLCIGQGSPANHISAAKDIERAYHTLGPVRFETMIRTMQNGFNGSKDIWKSATIKGMTEFYKSYTDYNIDENILTQQLMTLDLEETLKKAKIYNTRNSISGFVWFVATAYNKRRGGKNRLDLERILKGKDK